MKRMIIIVLDSVGVGVAMPRYGDQGANTVGNIADRYQLPNMRALGFGQSGDAQWRLIHRRAAGMANGGKIPGKDTTTGHWKSQGFSSASLFPRFPTAFRG